MKNVLVFGALGTAGAGIVKQGLSAGHKVTAFSRTGEYPIQGTNLSVVKGDLQVPSSIGAVLEIKRRSVGRFNGLSRSSA